MLNEHIEPQNVFYLKNYESAFCELAKLLNPCNIHVASTPEEGLELARSRTYDLAVIDLTSDWCYDPIDPVEVTQVVFLHSPNKDVQIRQRGEKKIHPIVKILRTLSEKSPKLAENKKLVKFLKDGDKLSMTDLSLGDVQNFLLKEYMSVNYPVPPFIQKRDKTTSPLNENVADKAFV